MTIPFIPPATEPESLELVRQYLQRIITVSATHGCGSIEATATQALETLQGHAHRKDLVLLRDQLTEKDEQITYLQEERQNRDTVLNEIADFFNTPRNNIPALLDNIRTAHDEASQNKQRIVQFAACITRIAGELDAPACGGVMDGPDPGGHTAEVLVGEIRKVMALLGEKDAELERVRQDLRDQMEIVSNLTSQGIKAAMYETVTSPAGEPVQRSPVITNEMKAACIGEFSFTTEETCFPCYLDVPDKDCERCAGEQLYTQTHTVPWDTCKEIYKAMAAVAMQPQKPGEGDGHG